MVINIRFTEIQLHRAYLHIDCFQKYFVRFVKYLIHWINEQKVLIMFLLIIQMFKSTLL